MDHHPYNSGCSTHMWVAPPAVKNINFFSRKTFETNYSPLLTVRRIITRSICTPICYVILSASNFWPDLQWLNLRRPEMFRFFRPKHRNLLLCHYILAEIDLFGRNWLFGRKRLSRLVSAFGRNCHSQNKLFRFRPKLFRLPEKIHSFAKGKESC